MPRLITYPPLVITSAKELEAFKLSPSFPSQEYGLALTNVVEQLKFFVSSYQEKLFPVFSQMSQMNQKKRHVGMNVLIAKARGYNAEWFQSYLTFKQDFEKLSEANDKTKDGNIKIKTAKLIDLGRDFTENCLDNTSALRELLDISEGYVKARVEWNLSFLTKKNEQRFNELSTSLHQSGLELNEQADNFKVLLVELNGLLDKGSY